LWARSFLLFSCGCFHLPPRIAAPELIALALGRRGRHCHHLHSPGFVPSRTAKPGESLGWGDQPALVLSEHASTMSTAGEDGESPTLQIVATATETGDAASTSTTGTGSTATT